MASRLKELNPSVEVEGIPKPLERLTDQELRSFHIVVGTHGLQGVDELAAATDRLCGADGEPAAAPNGNGNGKKRLRDEAPEAKGNGSHEIVPTRSGAMPQLLAAGTLGLFGFCALDLMAHTHRVVKKAKKEDEEPPPPEHFVVRYPALRDAFRVGWRSLDRRTPRLYAALQLLLRGGGQEEVEARRAERLEEDGLKETFLREPLTAEYVATVAPRAAESSREQPRAAESSRERPRGSREQPRAAESSREPQPHRIGAPRRHRALAHVRDRRRHRGGRGD